MNFIKQMDRIKKTHSLILIEKTGTPDDFAAKLNISRSQLYNIIDVIKDFDAPIKYSKRKESFYYEKPFELELHYSLKTILDDEVKEIYGGSSLRPIFLDGSIFNLQ